MLEMLMSKNNMAYINKWVVKNNKTKRIIDIIFLKVLTIVYLFWILNWNKTFV